MAVIHFKSKGSMMFWTLLWTIAGLIYFMVNGEVSLPVIIFWIVLIMLQPILVLLGSKHQSGSHGLATSHRKYETALNNSMGIEKLRLKIRSNSTKFGMKLKKNNEDDAAISIGLPIMETYMHLADTFYTLLKESDKCELFDEFAEEVVSDEDEEFVVSSRLFGIAFSITLNSVAATTNLKVKKAAVKNFINSCLLNETCKKELLKTTTSYFNFKNSATKEDWSLLENTTYALVGAKIKRGADDIADPITIMPLKTAIAYVQNNIQVKDYYIKGFKEEGLIG